ncbi:hypothetical protein YC2023_031086 [Brassica napus]
MQTEATGLLRCQRMWIKLLHRRKLCVWTASPVENMLKVAIIPKIQLLWGNLTRYYISELNIEWDWKKFYSKIEF